jgi:hypothetical protein
VGGGSTATGSMAGAGPSGVISLYLFGSRYARFSLPVDVRDGGAEGEIGRDGGGGECGAS